MGEDVGGLLAEIAELIGAEAAGRLCRACGGVSYYLPAKPKPTHPWAQVVGLEAMEILCAQYGGSRLTLPKGDNAAKRRRVLQLLREGRLSVRQIAIKAGVTERYVSKMRGRQDEARLPLFDGF